jgi:hypothetical protein
MTFFQLLFSNGTTSAFSTQFLSPFNNYPPSLRIALDLKLPLGNGDKAS